MNNTIDNESSSESQAKKSNCLIYFADLEDYNNGLLRGCVIDIASLTPFQEIEKQIQEMLAVKGNKGWAVHDDNNIFSSSASPNPKTSIEIVGLIELKGYELDQGFLSCFSGENIDPLEKFFIGIHISLEDYACEFINNCHDLNKQMGDLASYFDYAAFAHDLERNGDLQCVQLIGEVPLFHSY